MADAVLALNAGSSSIKFGLYESGGRETLHLVARGVLDLGDKPSLKATAGDGSPLADRKFSGSDEAALGELLEWIEDLTGKDRLVAAGHRIVHGGERFARPVHLTSAVVEAIEEFTPLAPLHQPRSLAPIRALASLRPKLRQIGCFDTAFHHTMSEPVTRIALPRRFEAEGVRRYGFHGLSYEYIAGRIHEISPQLAAGRVVVAHLGNGASLCAMRDGKSVDTTMGFSALDGLVMGTRCGSIDPGVLLYLMEKGFGAADLQRLLYEESGLLGVSGMSGDMRTLLASDDPRAREAVELFVFRAARETAALVNTLGGLDGLVFTAGIGEHSAPIRSAICKKLEWLGVKIDPACNDAHAELISTPDSAVEVHVMPTDEELVIARHVLDVQGSGGG